MKLIGYLLAVCSTIAAVPSVAATYIDYSVYATDGVTIAGGSYGTIASGAFATSHADPGKNYVSRVTSSATLTEQALSFSQLLRDLTPTGAFAAIGPTRGTLTGTGAGTNVFSLTAEQFEPLIRLTFAGPGEGAIINVSGNVLSAPTRFDFGSLMAQNVIFNFYDATSVSFAGADVRGSILAPLAHLSYAGGTIAGTVAADSFSSAGTEIGGIGFTAQVTSGVPEPAAWTMMILGFGATGTVLRRRAGRASEGGVRALG